MKRPSWPQIAASPAWLAVALAAAPPLAPSSRAAILRGRGAGSNDAPVPVARQLAPLDPRAMFGSALPLIPNDKTTYSDYVNEIERAETPGAPVLAALILDPALLETHEAGLRKYLSPKQWETLRRIESVASYAQASKRRHILLPGPIGQELAPRGRAILEQLSRMAKEDVVPGYNEVGSPELALQLLRKVDFGYRARDYGDVYDYLKDLAESSADSPAAQILSALLVDPKLTDQYKSDLDLWLGKNHANLLGSDRLRDWYRWFIGPLSNHGELSDFVRLGAISQSGAPKGRALLADLHRRYHSPPVAAPSDDRDASAPAARPAERSEKAPAVRTPPKPAVAWPIDRPSGSRQIVLSLQRAGDRWLLNGKAADALDASVSPNGVGESVVVHPDDPDVVVKLFHSPGSLSAHERKEARVDGLRRLSAAGAAPALLEHGEAAVPGLGRVYFYAQRRLRGTPLSALESWPPRAVSALLERLKRAALVVFLPAASARQWLLSRVVLDGKRAYLLGADAAPAEPEHAAAAAGLMASYLTPARSQESSTRAGADVPR